MAVHATTTPINCAAIMTAAWTGYRTARQCRFAAGDETGKRRFLPTLFASCLRRAWEDARAEQRNAMAREADRLAVQLQDRIRQSQRDLVARMAPEARAARITSVRGDLTLLDYAPWGVRTSLRRADLSAELSLLEAA